MKTTTNKNRNIAAISFFSLAAFLLLFTSNLSAQTSKEYTPELQQNREDILLHTDYLWEEAPHALYAWYVEDDGSNLAIHVITDEVSDITLQIFDITGKLVFENSMTPVSKRARFNANDLSLSTSVYIARIHQGNRTESKKFYKR